MALVSATIALKLRGRIVPFDFFILTFELLISGMRRRRCVIARPNRPREYELFVLILQGGMSSFCRHLFKTMRLPSPTRLLIVEDNVRLVQNLFAYFEPRGYQLDAAEDSEAGLFLAQQGGYQALIVDWGLPSRPGIDVVRDLRARDIDVPILMLTARADIAEKVLAFRTGVDDYLTKPFALAELEVRIESLLSRSRGRRRRLVVADLVLDLDSHSAQRGSRQVALSRSERRLLETLMRASPAVVARAELERTLWGDNPPDGDMLRSHMYELRHAIDAGTQSKLLHTVRGVGYLLALQSAD